MRASSHHRSERAQFKSAFRLITEVIRVGGDAPRWTNRLLDGLIELFNAKFTACAVAPIPTNPTEWVRAEVSLQRGLTEPETRLFIEGYWAEGNTYRSEFLRRAVAIRSRFVTVRREDVMSDEEWYASDAYTKIHLPIGIDAQMESHFVVPKTRQVFGIAVHRGTGTPPFSIAQRRQLRRLHLELARAWHGTIVVPETADPVVAGLAPRLREVLWMLCVGMSEKEVAHQLQLSPRTIHNHVVRLHAAFGVNSRGELLARVLNRDITEKEMRLPDSTMNQYTKLT